ncbi:hypothetical protein WJX84_011968 [Apatococcus fuscideae]|uniref:Uncharacterized protein n=1 Tax=Apatococcus fuscideae TaxID=2026836 RepID=A0AAW1T9B6_9CHLO
MLKYPRLRTLKAYATPGWKPWVAFCTSQLFLDCSLVKASGASVALPRWDRTCLSPNLVSDPQDAGPTTRLLMTQQPAFPNESFSGPKLEA